MKRYKSVDEFLQGQSEWQAELIRLREIIQQTGLDETVKWGAPTYTYLSKSVVGLASFKSYFGLWFFQGALLKDSSGVLMNAQQGKTKAMRQWRMTNGKDIKVRIIKSYVKEACAIQDAGQEIKAERDKPVVVPAELQREFDRRPATQKIYSALTTGRRREFADYVAGAKQEATRLRRVEKILPMIDAGIGLNDKYRS